MEHSLNRRGGALILSANFWFFCRNTCHCHHSTVMWSMRIHRFNFPMLNACCTRCMRWENSFQSFLHFPANQTNWKNFGHDCNILPEAHRGKFQCCQCHSASTNLPLRNLNRYIKKLQESIKGKTPEELKSEENQIKITALKTTSNISTLIRDLFHSPPSFKSAVNLSWIAKATANNQQVSELNERIDCDV